MAMNQKKICYIGQYFETGGSETLLRNDVLALRNIGCEVQVIDTLKVPFSIDLVDKNVDKIICFDLRSAALIKGDKALKQKTMVFAIGRADYHLDPQGNIGKVAELILKGMVETNKLYKDKWWRKYFFLSGIYYEYYDVFKSYEIIYVPSNLWGEQLKKTFNVNYVKIPLGLNKAQWFSNKVYEKRKELKILIPTGFYRSKKLDSGLQKINKVIGSLGEKVFCDFIWYNREYRWMMNLYNKRYSNINFIRPAPDPKSLFLQYDLMVHPSLGDAFCQVALECFSCGLPCLVSSVSEDLLGEHVICMSTKDERYEDTLRRLILDYNLRESLSTRALRFANKWMSWEERARLIVKEAGLI